MLYHVTRNGQSYGPYTLEDLQRYVASGNVLPTDLARSESMSEWLPVSQVLGGAVPASYAPPPAPGYAGPGYAATGYAPQAGAAAYPDPPNLHWGLVLLIGVFTCGLFIAVWDIVQSAWMRKVNPRSNALFFYIGEIVLSFAGSGVRTGLMIASGMHHRYMGAGLGLFIITFTLIIFARFDMKRSMEEYFNGPEPIGLVLGPVMTFFFGSLYFQYHFSRINEMKRMARYGGAAM